MWKRVPGEPKNRWEKLSNQTKNVYVTRATTAIVALEVITPGDAGHLWTAVQSSRGVKTALAIDDNIYRKYLEALVKIYQHATSWDTRRQVLAIMADLVPYRDIQKSFVSPEILHYIYNALVQPHFDYCGIVWGNCGKTLALSATVTKTTES